jgi:PAP2 superfamily
MITFTVKNQIYILWMNTFTKIKFRKTTKISYLIVTFFILNILNYSTFAQANDSLATTKIKPLDFSKEFDVQEYKINQNLTYQYQKPKFWDFVTKLPSDFGLFGKQFIERDNLIWFGASVGSTLALIPIDQKITDSSRDFGAKIGFSDAHTYSGPLKSFPTNINSGIYKLGNGFTAILVGGGLLTYGLIKHNYRAVHTSSEIVEGLIASGLLVQPFKRITGRESPFIAEQNGNSGGAWNPFPSFKAYAKETPNYDAMPSGHLTTLMTTVVIISENYKEVKWIKPVGYGLMGLMSFEMLQSKVHWASDYPLAIFMGYLIGKSIVKNRITEKITTNVGDLKKFKPKFHYSFGSNQNFSVAGISMIF